MGIFDRVLDGDKTHEFSIEDTKYVVKRAEVEEVRKFVDEHANPELKDDAMKADRKAQMNRYFAEQVIVSIDDPDLADTPENRLMILTYPAFDPDADRIRNEAYTDSNFRMGRDEALKKFSATISEASDIGSANTAETVLGSNGISNATERLAS